MNEASKIFRPATQEEITLLVEAAFGKGVQFTAEMLKGGLFNTTYHIMLPENSIDAVLRIGPVRRELLLPFEHNLMAAEAYVNKLLGEKEIPCSRVIRCDTSKTLIDRDYMLVEYIESKPLSGLDLPAAISKELYAQAGAYAAQMHQIKGKQFGRVSLMLQGEAFHNWFDYLQSEIAHWGEMAVDSGIYTIEDYTAIKKTYTQYASLLNEVDSPTLVHADLWEGNVLISQGAGQWGVAAIIDGDRAIFGDKLFDFAGGWMINDDFLRGYGETESSSKAAQTRMKLYSLLCRLLDSYVWLAQYDNRENSDGNKQEAFQLLNELA